MRSSKRAERRVNRARMERRARVAYPDWERAAEHADHLKVCSCWMCGNPRCWMKGSDRLTIQEKRAWLQQE